MSTRLNQFLEQCAIEKTFFKGNVICQEGQQADEAYYVIDGAVEIYKNEGGAPVVVATLGAGDIFGEMALLRFDRYTLSARAVMDVKAYAITPELLQEQIRQTHPLIKAILDSLLDRVQESNQVLIDLDRANRA